MQPRDVEACTQRFLVAEPFKKLRGTRNPELQK